MKKQKNKKFDQTNLLLLLPLIFLSLVGCDAIEEQSQLRAEKIAKEAAKQEADNKQRLDNLYNEIKKIPAKQACVNQNKYELLLTNAELVNNNEYADLAKNKIEIYTSLCKEERRIAFEEAEKRRILNEKGKWVIDSYVDDFGDKTNDKFMVNSVEGTFSNSATNNSFLYARVFIDGFPEPEIHFRLSEYNRNSPVTGYMTYGQSFSGRVRDEDGNTSSFRLTLSKGSVGLLPGKRDQDKLLALLKSQQKLRFIIREIDGTAVYNFTIDANHYLNAQRIAQQ